MDWTTQGDISALERTAVQERGVPKAHTILGIIRDLRRVNSHVLDTQNVPTDPDRPMGNILQYIKGLEKENTQLKQKIPVK